MRLVTYSWYNMDSQKDERVPAIHAQIHALGKSLFGSDKLMSNIPQSSGIYLITCLNNGKIYIGSAVNIRDRWLRHCKELRSGNHPNPHLQNAWNKHGEDAFTFEVIEECERQNLLSREQYWLDQLRPYETGFNVARSSTAPMLGRKQSPQQIALTTSKTRGQKRSPEFKNWIRIKQTGRIASKEARQKMSAAKIGKKLPLETRTKMGRAAEGNKNAVGNKGALGKKRSPEARQHIGISKSLNWIVVSPDGEEMTISNLAEFCRTHGLNKGRMVQVARGKERHHKGWRCRYA